MDIVPSHFISMLYAGHLGFSDYFLSGGCPAPLLATTRRRTDRPGEASDARVAGGTEDVLPREYREAAPELDLLEAPRQAIAGACAGRENGRQGAEWPRY